MDDMALIQLVRELDELKKEVADLKESLQPVFKREESLQMKEQLNKKYPYGWDFIDPDHPEKGIIGY